MSDLPDLTPEQIEEWRSRHVSVPDDVFWSTPLPDLEDDAPPPRRKPRDGAR